MKKLLILVLLLVSCGKQVQREWVETTTCKTIKAKDSPIENKFSSGDFILGNGSVTKSQTVYYFYFEDGTSKSVHRETFFKFDIGETYCIKSGYYKTIQENEENLGNK